MNDWRLFKAGDARAAGTLVNSLTNTCQALEQKGMKVSRDKTALLASNGTARKHLRQAAGPELLHMVALEIKDLGVDSTLGPLRRITTQRKRTAVVAGTARRIAQIPLG